MKAVDALGQAQAIIRDRGAIYGDARGNMHATAARFSMTLSHKVTAAQVCLLMIDLKLARLKETPNHIDSVMDIMGYAALLAEVITD
jgi:hypothetical protein